MKRAKTTTLRAARGRLAKRIGARLCSRCGDARGGARSVGNANIVDGVVLCDYCHSDHLRG